MVDCPRCGRDVDDLQIATPDLLTKEAINSIDHGEEDFAEDDGVEVCPECLDELKNN